MSDNLIRQHKNMAMGEGPDVPSIPNPFPQVNGSDIPRGELKDSQRKAKDCDGDKY